MRLPRRGLLSGDSEHRLGILRRLQYGQRRCGLLAPHPAPRPAVFYLRHTSAARRRGIPQSLRHMPKYDAIIVGGGHNGLVTAAYHARAGRKVLVLERRELVGGCSVTEEVWPGYRVSTGAYLTSLLQQRIVQE